ncbi:hypothetical protein IE81DRAFT_98991 [Ceraceosorus guamensis]|uniref:Uncharacterized protein n=1 Tax=Ceraceosorus guamensis TaxID=1522189 RepID=A0A316W0Z7_9BASI|nr:hypothetical protein IE81DRAFT_98991 [Ceraceosorus guamensis]PWN43174.1 hypothetical protein IE81DRAFT_98991 [Ceraceosorus guamensis]
MAPLQPVLLEMPLHLCYMGFGAAMMGLSGSHLARFNDIRQTSDDSATSTYPGFVYVSDNGMNMVDLGILIISAITFVTGILFAVLSCSQFRGRRGEYSGKGTGAWFLVGFWLLLLSGAWAGLVSAYTAFSVQRIWQFEQGPSFAGTEPFDIGHRLYLNQIDYYLTAQRAQTLDISGPLRFVDESFLGEWGSVTTLQQANDLLASRNGYVHAIQSYKATVAIGWVTLGVVFFTMAVHFALPFVWKWLGFIRQPEKKSYNEM